MAEGEEESAGALPKAMPEMSLTIHDLLRYGYVGIISLSGILYCCALAYNQTHPKPLESVKSLDFISGPVVAAIALLAIPLGAVVYVISRLCFVLPVAMAVEIIYCIVAKAWRAVAPNKKYRAGWKNWVPWILMIFGAQDFPARFMLLRDEFSFSYSEAEFAFFVIREYRRREKGGKFEADGLWPKAVQTQFIVSTPRFT